VQNREHEADLDGIPSLTWKIQPIRGDAGEPLNDYVIIEESLDIVVNGKSIAVLMRLPGHEK
jgi:formate dehydrogenase assembly factor FdhD